MIEKQEIPSGGQTYVCWFDDAAPPERSWRWMRASDYIEPPLALQSALNRALIAQRARIIAEGMDFTEQVRFVAVLRAMGASDGDLESAGLERARTAVDRPYLIRCARATLPPAGRTPFNCPTLRDWFFSQRQPKSLMSTRVACLGESPFPRDDFARFLQQRGVLVVEPASIIRDRVSLLLEEIGDRVVEPRGLTQVVVIGREGWTEHEVDDVIDSHVGCALHVYSQEMFLSYLATDEDPFYGGNMVLEAFRAGHPGLEFISQGWPGWIQAWVLPDRRLARETRRRGFQAEESPIHVMGYRVGESGLETETRRRILERAFKGPLPIVGTREYMEQWGEPGSPPRLRKIAENIAAYCQGNRNRSGWEKAIADWQSDLEWLKDTFYHGHFQFHWPDTFVYDADR